MKNIEQFIDLKQDLVISDTFSNEKTVHILLCFDNNYALSAGVCILSIIANNPSYNLNFQLFTNNLNEEHRQKFSQINAPNISITEYMINDQFKIDEKNVDKFPLSACTRLIAPYILKDVTDKLLYVDSDTLCLKDLGSLIDIDLENNILAARADIESMQIKKCKKYPVKYGTYFNTGVMLINVNLWNEYEITNKVLTLLNDGQKYRYPDQDVLNIAVGEKRITIPEKFNYFTELSPDGNEDSKVPQDTVIIHFTTKNKPWHRPFRTKLYDSYIAKSPWKNAVLPLYKKGKSSPVRQYSRLMRDKGHYLEAIGFYLLYLYKKLIQRC